MLSKAAVLIDQESAHLAFWEESERFNDDLAKYAQEVL